jgi:hypothetical protein
MDIERYYILKREGTNEYLGLIEWGLCFTKDITDAIRYKDKIDIQLQLKSICHEDDKEVVKGVKFIIQEIIEVE